MGFVNWRSYATLTDDNIGPTGKRRLDRLDRLADYLDTVPRDKFDMQEFGVQEEGCATVACIAGHSTRVVRELRLEPNFVNRMFMDLVNIRTKENHGVSAFADAFGLDLDVAYALTEPDAPHQTPKQAAKAVRRLAAEIRRRSEELNGK